MEEMIERIKFLEQENEDTKKSHRGNEMATQTEELRDIDSESSCEKIHSLDTERELEVLRNNANYDELEKQQLRKDLEDLIVKLDSLQNQQYDLQVEFQKVVGLLPFFIIRYKKKTKN